MITSFSNAKVKQVAAWQTKAKERKKDQVFLAEGLKMFEEAPVDWIREVYIIEEILTKTPWHMQRLQPSRRPVKRLATGD